MDDFHDSMPEQRELHNPNVEYVPFEEIKKRILKIVDGYNGWVECKLNGFANCSKVSIANLLNNMQIHA